MRQAGWRDCIPLLSLGMRTLSSERMWLLLSLSPDTHKAAVIHHPAFIILLFKHSGQIWPITAVNNTLLFLQTNRSDSAGRQWVIHCKNMEAYHRKQKHRSLSSTTKKIGKEKLCQCLHAFIDVISIWALIRLQNLSTCGSCMTQQTVKKAVWSRHMLTKTKQNNKNEEEKESIFVQESFLWRLQRVREMMGH